jgi:uncharacterized protein with PIN domain
MNKKERDQTYRKKHYSEILKRNRAYYEKNKSGERGRRFRQNNDYKYRYGITLDMFEAMVFNQKGRCACCGREMIARHKKEGKDPCLDHNHKTGKIRAVICRLCNSIVGICDDNVEILRKAIGYIIAYNG